MRAAYKPGGAARRAEPYTLAAELIARLEGVLCVQLSPDLRAEVKRRVETFVGMQRYIARSQRSAEVRAQLADVAAHAEGLAAGMAALGPDAEARYLDHVGDADEIAQCIALRTVRMSILPAARAALDELPGDGPERERGPQGNPILAALVGEAAELFKLLKGAIPVSNRGPFVEFVRAIDAALPDDLRFHQPAKLGDRIKTIVERMLREAEAG